MSKTLTLPASPQGAVELKSPPLSAEPRRIRFGPVNDFQRELKRRVDRLFEDTGLSRHGGWPMLRKTIVILMWLAASYGLLVFASPPLWAAILLAISVALAAAGVGFNIQHDGGHRAYSRRRTINKLMAMTADLVGGSSYFWDRKHNYLHHTFANITGHDDDIDLGILGRLSPHQPRRRFHRFQHLYLWPLYGFLTIKWQLIDDFAAWAKGRILNHPVARPRGWDLAVFLGGKAVFLSLAFVIPLLFYPLWVVLLFYLGISLLEGVVLSIVFQLAHCVEGTAFPLPDEADGRIANNWYVHQIETTANFARASRFLTWYLGGLNFQVEHHLFPATCHVHYPRVSRIVEDTCREYGVNYTAHPTFLHSLRLHYRWLRQMGREA